MELEDRVEDNMIEVKGAYKRYDKNTEVLRNLNMTVERGSIYAFLGPSGCGKTTLLKCIVGRMRLDAGEINLGVSHRSQIGYMPQDTALVSEISIKETLSYFGWMYGLKGAELERRKQELFAFLDIPSENKKIKKLSGGQQRRVSLCVALLNDPDLMILDEPTVGVDPLLSYSIWQCLLQMSKRSNKTILLTTHYIEEAMQADKVGMMRRGLLLTEGEGTTIIEKYNCSTLEEVFIHLSTQQETSSCSSTHSKTKDYSLVPKVNPKLPLAEEKSFSLRNFISLLLKNIYFLKYSPLGWFLTLFVPITVAILFEFSVGKDAFHMKLGIVNEELDHKICDNYNSTCTLASCEYIAQLEDGFEIIIYQDIDDAYSDAKRSRILGFLHLPQNFTQYLHKRIMEKALADNETIVGSEISVWIDMTSSIIATKCKKKIYFMFIKFLKQLSITCSWSVNSFGVPFHFEHPIYGPENPKFIEFSIVGMLLMLEFFLPVTYAVALLDDKVEGILERSFIAGHTAAELMVTQVFVSVILFFVATTLVTTIVYGIFSHTFEGSAVLAFALLTIVGIGGIFYGISVALLFEDHTSATTFVLSSFFPLIVLSGMIWPTEAMHSFLQYISWLLPLTYATEAYRSIAARSWTISYPKVYLGFLSGLLWAFIFIVLTIILVKRKLGMAIK